MKNSLKITISLALALLAVMILTLAVPGEGFAADHECHGDHCAICSAAALLGALSHEAVRVAVIVCLASVFIFSIADVSQPACRGERSTPVSRSDVIIS